MSSSRRHFLQRSLGVAAVTFTGSGCERFLSGTSSWLGQGFPDRLQINAGSEIDDAFHLLSRASFGPWPGEVERLQRMGADAWLDEQLHPDRIDDTACNLRARRFESVMVSAGDAFEFKEKVLREEIPRHTLLRAIYSRRQLHEVMVEFWTDHLNIDLNKGDCLYLKPSDDREVIRKHALGNFRELIRASATSPAMLVYLDGASNKVRRGTDDVPNENYARELLELHTLGVDGGYTQQDVLEAARCLSGWTFNRKRKFALNRGQSYFRADWHDGGAKTVLGKKIPPGGGELDLDRLIYIVCRHPSTAHFLATKLCHRFIGENPPAAVIDDVASVFALTDGDIAASLRALFTSEAFAASKGTAFKRPFRLVVSAMRALAADTHAHRGALEPLTRMGQGMFEFPTPDGYPDETSPWLGTLMWRWNFAQQLTRNQLGKVRINPRALCRALRVDPDSDDAVPALFAHLVGRQPDEDELAALTDGSQNLRDLERVRAVIALTLASPAFQRC